MKKIKITSLIFAFIIFVSFMSAVNISAEGTDQHRHVWIMTEEESPIHDAENGGHRQVRECAATVNGERCTETRVFYVRRPGCELCAAKDGECSHTDILCIGEQSAHPHYKVYECQECGYQFTNGTMANWSWNYYSTSSTHTSGLGHAITQKCSKCSATQIGGYDTDYPGCCQCGNHTFISGYTQYLYSSAHPHAEYYRCEVCDANVYTGGYYSGEYPGCSACHVHNYSYSSYYQTAHPHYKVNVCSCGAEQVTSVTSTNTSCCDCGYHSYSSYSYYQTAHPHYKVNVCSCGAEQVTSVTSTNTSCCQCGYHTWDDWEILIYHTAGYGHLKERFCLNCNDGYEEWGYVVSYDCCDCVGHNWGTTFYIGSHINGYGHSKYVKCNRCNASHHIEYVTSNDCCACVGAHLYGSWYDTGSGHIGYDGHLQRRDCTRTGCSNYQTKYSSSSNCSTCANTNIHVIYGVPTYLTSSSDHYCIPCAITNCAVYWARYYGWSDLDYYSGAVQDSIATAVQNKMITESNSPTGNKANVNIHFGFEYFSYSDNQATYSFDNTNYDVNSFSWNDITGEIEDNKPLMLGFANTPNSPYKSHSTVCVGYYIENEIKYVLLSDAHQHTYQVQVFDQNDYNDFICIVTPTISYN